MSSNKITLAQLKWSDEAAPLATAFDDYYFSSDDGIAEVEHTFMQGNQLAQRFAQQHGDFRIIETGFGSGLNFLLASQHWLELTDAEKQQQLHFISVEKYPLSLADLTQVHQGVLQLEQGDLPRLSQIAQELQNQYPFITAGWHDLYLFDGRVRLTLWFGDALKGLTQLDASLGSLADAWFLDGFAPAKNPDMWQPGLYQQMNRLSHANATFATFTAAGDVRRSLEKAGFKVIKQSGYGKKREMCFGHIEHKRPHSLKAPWFSRPEPLLNGQAGNAIVVGAGLAGAAVAHKLASEGWQVKVLEAAQEVATLASGNQAGTVHPLITADWNLRSQWYLQGFEATLRQVLPWLQNAPEMGRLDGLLELGLDKTVLQRQASAMQRVGVPENLAQAVSQQQAAELLGVSTAAEAALYFPLGGWLYPKALVEQCLQHKNIKLLTGGEVTGFTQKAQKAQQKWRVEVQVDNQPQYYEADALIVTTGSLNEQFNQILNLPIRPVKGQVTHLSTEQVSNELKIAVTHGGYSVSHSQGAVTGATFEAPDMSDSLSTESHQENLNTTQKALPGWVMAKAHEVKGRVAFRPTTPDHLPIIGPVPKPEWLEQAYLSQSHTHAVYRYPEQQYQQGLYVSNGHGPRGLMSVFLAADIIAADIKGDALLQPLSLYHASHPARFQIRKWRSGG